LHKITIKNIYLYFFAIIEVKVGGQFFWMVASDSHQNMTKGGQHKLMAKKFNEGI
jgi:hypothetical protein